ncbi:SUF system Fe-S cluster assembly regulator [Pusillimonas sp. TS35]|uniref:SUF system Fe-S cluster assembly regulator n=1 Tax=Paracandidimonas lactea TaxID=2895524 RepID=UPI00136E0490|nr:SUF system Fe-S cluster assembly regulator [Pusillimonas sp. TS35]
MLRISKIMDYGTLVLTHMAGAPTGVYSAADLAATLGLGQPTVSKILKLLGQHGLVRGSRGARGGYTLSRPASQISIADVIDALEEQPFGLTECTAQPGACSVEAGCHIRSNWQRINAIVRRTLEDVSIADMTPPGAIPGGTAEFSLNFRPGSRPAAPAPQSKSRVAEATTWSLPE